MQCLPIDRRSLLIASVAAPFAAAAQAQNKPKGRPTKIVVGFPPGQATDVIARMLAERLQRASGDTWLVENIPGQGGSLALGHLAKAAADGSVTMLAHMSALATNPHLYKSVPYDTLKDFDAVGLVGDLPFVLVCNPQMPFGNIAGLVAFAKANPEKLTNASSGNGTVSHLAFEEFKRKAGIKVTHIPYKGSGPGLTDVMAGNVALALETAASVQPHVQSGKLRALAAGSAVRLAGLPGVPTLQEQGFDNFNAVTWLMLLLPAGAGRAQRQSLFNEMTAVTRTSEVEQRLLAIGALPRNSANIDEADAYMRAEFKAWGEVVRRSGVALE